MANSAAKLTDRHYTWADYLKFPDDERWEIIDGVAYNMAPAPSASHQSLLSELATQIGTQLRSKTCKLFVAPFDVRFERKEDTDKVVQPDLLVVCDKTKITPQGLIGAPDWIVEILSPKTASKDHVVKRALYEREGVREFWLVHPADLVLTIYRLGANGIFDASVVVDMKGRVAVTAVPDLQIDWDLWEPPFPPEA